MFKKIFAVSLFAVSSLAATAQAGESFKTVSDVPWEIQQPSSSSEAERNQAALGACTAKIATTNQAAREALAGTATVEFRNVALVRRYGDWSKTSKDDWTGKRKHKAGGLAECSYYQIVNMI